MRFVILLLVATTLLLPAAVCAQRNLGVTGGVLMPVGNFGDIADPSPYIGARWEMQDVNALGQVAELSFFVQGGFAFLGTASDLEAALLALGQGVDDGSLFDIGVGVRVYSNASPVFLGAGASFLNYEFAGGGDSEGGFGAHIAVGAAVGPSSFRFDIEGRGNIGLFDSDNITYFQLLASLGLPF